MVSVNEVRNYIDKYKRLNSEFDIYGKMYLFTTENIKEYLSKLDLNDKKVLTVCGSGDQLLNAYLMGAKDVTCFDINKLAYPLLLFKLAAVRTLSYEEFMKFFIEDGNSDFLSIDYYKKIRVDLDKDTKEIFDYIFENFSNIQIYDKFFYNFIIVKSRMNKLNAYFDPYHFEILKSKINGIQPEFIRCNITELPSVLSSSYDLMLFSNISDAIENIYGINAIKKYRDLLLQISKYLNSFGVMQAGYIYEANKSIKEHLFESEIMRKKEFKFGNAFKLDEYNLQGFRKSTTDKVVQVRKLS